MPSAATCATYLGSTPLPAFATLPKEYGPLAIVVFSLPLLGSAGLYPWLFAAEMIAVVLGVALLLHRIAPVGAGRVWLLNVMLGSAATAAARFDVVPAACTLLALVALTRGHHSWAYAALAAGTLLKIYPALLLPLFLIESWRMRGTIPLWRRGPGLYAAAVVMVEGVAWLLNPASALRPATFMRGRCVQVGSLPASLSALGALVSREPISFLYSYNSICQVSSGLGVLSAICIGMAMVGIAAVIVLYWRGAISLGLAALLLLALALLGSEVFSPQYLLWISPLVAWEFGLRDLRAFAGWCLVCLATTLCYPLSYHEPAARRTADHARYSGAAHRGAAQCAALGVGSGNRRGRLRQLAAGLYCANQLRISRSRMSRERGWPVRERL